MTEFTTNYHFAKPDFDISPWHDQVNTNFDLIDTLIFAFTGLGNVKGEWENNTAYTQGDRVVDGADGSLWRCAISHTSPVAPTTFAQDRVANPTRWDSISQSFGAAVQWTTATTYGINDFVFDGHRYGVVLANYTSGATYDADVLAGNIATLADLTTSVTTATTAATNASNSAAAAGGSATAAANSALSASGSATTASTAASNASTSETNAAASASSASTSASTATTAANNAATTFDLFDDRMLGAKASDPTLDNDGNALVTGAMYWNTSAGNLRFWSGSAWVVSTLNGMGVFINGLTLKNDIVGADKFVIADSANSFDQRGVTATRVKAWTNDDPVFSGLIQGSTFNEDRNLIINGGFNMWQRATSQTSNGYGSDDRWFNEHVGSSKTASRQAFTLGQTAVPGEPTYFSRTVVTSSAGAGNYVKKAQHIESVKTFAGQQITYTVWAKADASRPVTFELGQFFGTGGSPSSFVTGLGINKVTLTTSWQKFSFTVTLPSISGKTLGTAGDDFLEFNIWMDAGSSHNARTSTLGQQSGTFDIARVSIVPGNATNEDDPYPYRSLQNEIAKCYRYYYVATVGGGVSGYPHRVTNMGAGAQAACIGAAHPVYMRSATITKGIVWEISDVAQGGLPTFFNAGIWNWEVVHSINAGASIDVTAIVMDAEL